MLKNYIRRIYYGLLLELKLFVLFLKKFDVFKNFILKINVFYNKFINAIAIIALNFKNFYLFMIYKIKHIYANRVQIINMLVVFKNSINFISCLIIFKFIKENLLKIYNFYIEKEKIISDKLESLYDNKFNSDYLIKQNKSLSFHSLVNLLGSRQRNKIYCANPSLWPLFLSLFAGLFVILFVTILHNQNLIYFVNKQLLIAVFGSVICISFWITVFYKEKQLGFHTYQVRRNIRLGFYIFLFTEALCFLSLFWTLFHALLAAGFTIGHFNPGEGVVNFWLSEARVMHPYWNIFYISDAITPILINTTELPAYTKGLYDKKLSIKAHINLYDKGQLINPYGYPLVNTFILLTSAGILNCSHVKTRLGRYLGAVLFLSCTIALGFFFITIQYKEIKSCTLQYSDGIFASCFYSLTGLHGIHVVVGVFALLICLANFIKGNYSQKRHDTYWFSILYWHFVDVVWILVYLIAYLWPSMLFYSDKVSIIWLDFRSYCFNISTAAFEESLFAKLIEDCIDFNNLIIHLIISHGKIDIKSLKYSFSDDYMHIDDEYIATARWKESKIHKYFIYFMRIHLGEIFYFPEVAYHKGAMLYYFNEIYNNLDSFNYNKIKKNTAEYAMVYNILHFTIFSELNMWMVKDMRYKFYKFFFFFISLAINERFTFFWAKHFMPYMLNMPCWTDPEILKLIS